MRQSHSTKSKNSKTNSKKTASKRGSKTKYEYGREPVQINECKTTTRSFKKTNQTSKNK